MPDLIAITGLEWLYEVVEERWGRTAALLVTVLLLVMLGAVAWILVKIVNR